tara:strand:- start:737 stop:1021 length:285 start_codon:yes stop_codon:yes gene_type:complete
MSQFITASLKFVPLREIAPIPIVDKALAIIKSWDMNAEVGAQCTTIEGDFFKIMDNIKDLSSKMEEYCPRFEFFLNFSYSVDGVTIESRVAKHR